MASSRQGHSPPEPSPALASSHAAHRALSDSPSCAEAIFFVRSRQYPRVFRPARPRGSRGRRQADARARGRRLGRVRERRRGKSAAPPPRATSCRAREVTLRRPRPRQRVAWRTPADKQQNMRRWVASRSTGEIFVRLDVVLTCDSRARELEPLLDGSGRSFGSGDRTKIRSDRKSRDLARPPRRPNA